MIYGMFEEGERQINNRLAYCNTVFLFFVQVLILFKLILLEKKVRFEGMDI